MNAPIARLFGLVLVLFAALVAFTSRRSSSTREALRDNPKNRRALIEELRVKRGTIRAARRHAARALRARGRGHVPPPLHRGGAACSPHVIGFSDIDLGRAGIERVAQRRAERRRGRADDIVDQLGRRASRATTCASSIDLDAQRVALAGLNGRKGSVVAIEPATGRSARW